MGIFVSDAEQMTQCACNQQHTLRQAVLATTGGPVGRGSQERWCFPPSVVVNPFCLQDGHLGETEEAQHSHAFLKVNFPLCSWKVSSLLSL